MIVFYMTFVIAPSQLAAVAGLIVITVLLNILITPMQM